MRIEEAEVSNLSTGKFRNELLFKTFRNPNKLFPIFSNLLQVKTNPTSQLETRMLVLQIITCPESPLPNSTLKNVLFRRLIGVFIHRSRKHRVKSVCPILDIKNDHLFQTVVHYCKVCTLIWLHYASSVDSPASGADNLLVPGPSKLFQE